MHRHLGNSLKNPVSELRMQKKDIRQLLVYSNDQIISWVKMVELNHQDIEAVHQFRVKIRHLRSLIQFFRPILNKAWVDKVNHQLRMIATHFSPVREMDVMVEWWKDIHKHYPNAAVMNQLNQIKDKTRVEAIFRFDFDQCLQDLYQLNQKFLEMDIKLSPVSRGHFVMNRLALWEQKVVLNQAKIDTSDYPTMHKYRISTKKLRYVLSSFDSANLLSHKDVKEFKKLAETLGVLTDVQFIRLKIKDIVFTDREYIEKIYDYLRNKEKKAYTQVLLLLEKKGADDDNSTR